MSLSDSLDTAEAMIETCSSMATGKNSAGSRTGMSRLITTTPFSFEIRLNGPERLSSTGLGFLLDPSRSFDLSLYVTSIDHNRCRSNGFINRDLLGIAPLCLFVG